MMLAIVLSALVAQASPSPAPATGLCNADAHVVKAAIPEVEGLSQETLLQHLATEMQVTVAADGSVKSVAITKSSGYLDFDQAAIRAAKHSTYSPAFVNCHPQGGVAPFEAKLAPTIEP
jgi:TonB family protein